jgi:hypothetical protein
MTRFYRLADNDKDLPEDGLLAVELRNPDEKPRIRLVPATATPMYRQGGLSGAWYPLPEGGDTLPEGDDDEPDGWLLHA